MRAGGGHARRERQERGAAAVEFALVLLFLVPLLFGIIDFGFYFNDSLNARQGVREGARRGVLTAFTSCGAAATDYDKLKCQTKNEIGGTASNTYVKLLTPGGWAKGQPLVVCAIVKVGGATGFIPLPHNRSVYARTQMSIESAVTAAGAAPTGAVSADAPPTGTDWSWCT
jgi:hypothetical protein